MQQPSLPLRRRLCLSLVLPWFAPLARAQGRHSKDDAIKMVEKAVAMHTASGKARVLAAINQKNGPFHQGDLYVFAYDIGGTMLAHPVNPKLVGRNMLDVPDSNGNYWRKTIQKINASKGAAIWADYTYRNPVNGRNEPKSCYVRKFEDVIYCSGVYL